MAAPSDPPSPTTLPREAGNAYDDGWRQAEDEDDWPTLISTIEHDPHIGPKNHVDSTPQAEAEEAVLNGIVSGGGSGQSSRQASQQASQQALIKLLTRPVSSGKDPAAGFSFTKAKPVQQLDFRRPKQAPIIPEPPDLPRPSEGIPTETCSHQSSPLPDTAQIVQDVVDIAAHQDPLPQQYNPPVLKDTIPVPLPDATPAQTQAYKDPKPTITNGPITLNLSSIRALPNKVPMADDDNLADSRFNETKEPRTENSILPSHSNPTEIAIASIQSPADLVKVVDQPQVSKQNRSRKASKDPLNSVAGVAKVSKSRPRKIRMGPATGDPAPPSGPKAAYTEDDLLRLLMYRRRQGQQELEYFRATQQQKEVEIQQLRDLSNRLTSQLEEVIQRETQKTSELSKFRANKPIWENKIKRLIDYVKGLTNDHKRLRDDADDLQRQHTDIVVTSKELQSTLQVAQKSAEQERLRSQKLEDDAQHRIETLAQTVQHQNTQLRSDEGLLRAERERSSRLEDQISKVTASHEQLLHVFTSHRNTITGKIDHLVHQAKSLVLPTKAPEIQSPDPIRPMLEQCVGMLQRLHQADTVKPEDLRKLSDTVDSFVRGITLSVEACEENSASMERGQKQLALAMQDQFRALSGNISSEHALSEQISDLREVRATARERLHATESSLADARREIVALQLRDQEQSRRVMALEIDVAKAQSKPAEIPQALLRIQELDSRRNDLQSEVVTLSKEAADLSSQLQQKSAETKELTGQLSSVQEKLEAAREETATVREEKSAIERQAMLEREQLREDLSKATNMQLANMQSEHMKVVQQLEREKSPVEEKLKNVTNQLDMERAEKEKAEKETCKLHTMVKEAQRHSDAVVGTRKALQLHLKEMEVRMHEKNIEHRDMQALLRKANDRVKAKDLEVMALQASQATITSSSRVIEQNNTVRGVQSSSNGYTPRRNSQHALIDKTSSIRPINFVSSRHSTNRPPAAEDSQPTEKPSFVSLDDLILEDPFADYAQEGPQTIAGEDISHLFPSTPGAGSRAKDLDYSRNSVVHTTVVSETQRRQHQSFREALPQTGAHTTIKPHSQSQVRANSKAGQMDVMPRSSVATSPTKVNSSRHEPTDPTFLREASISRESTQPQGNIKDPRQGKRNTLAAGFNDTSSQARPRKLQRDGPAKQAKALGPVVEGSQSPILNGRSRKLTRRKSSVPKVDKFTRRFAQS